MIILLLIVGVIGYVIMRNRNPIINSDLNYTNQEDVVVEEPAACSSCSGNKTVNKFKMQPMGAELNPLSPISPKFRNSVGQISTFVDQPDITNLYRRPWQDFYKTSGQTVFAPGTRATWGLWRPWDDVPVRACGRTSIPVRNQPCNGIVRQMGELLYGKAQREQFGSCSN